jgi:hypothetical protein
MDTTLTNHPKVTEQINDLAREVLLELIRAEPNQTAQFLATKAFKMSRAYYKELAKG